MQHPEDHYRERLLRELAALNPEGVLEVGSGGGAFLRGAAQVDIAVEGIDADGSRVAKLQEEGYSARAGQAQRLEFPDASVDVVVFSYTAHHLADWNRSLLEAIRVSRRAVLILDPWYDVGLPSQSVASEFDRWCKAIDRSMGMVHNDCMDARALLAPVEPQRFDFMVRIEYLLVLRELGAEELAEAAAEQLLRVPDPARWRPALDEISRHAREHGFSDEGAILIVLAKRRDG